MDNINSELKIEAMKRLKLLSEQLEFPEEIFDYYKYGDNVMILDIKEKCFYPLITDVAEEIAFLEEEFDCHVYFVIKEPYRDVYHYLFVSYFEACWDEENYELECMSPRAYNIIPDDGTVCIGRVNLIYKGEKNG